MRRIDRQHVRALPLFRHLTEARFDGLLDGATLQEFPSHAGLLTQGEPTDSLYVLMAGAVELCGSHNDRETTIDIVPAVASINLATVIGGEVSLTSARTLAPTRVLKIPARAVRNMFEADAVFARAVGIELALRHEYMVRALKDQKLRSGAERLANWILTADHHQGDLGRIILPYDKRTLAARLGMTPENLSRSLATLSDHGISGSGREILIADRNALLQWARPDPLIDGGSGS